MVSDKVIGRLSLYRRLLTSLHDGPQYLFSHELASLVGVSAAQVRRDIMHIGYSGNPNRGYDVAELVKSIEIFIDPKELQFAALVGVGNLGRAILAYFSGRRPKLSIIAAFDIDPARYDRVVHGCQCYAMENLDYIVSQTGINVGIITVPATEAQKVTDMLLNAGVKGILNFAPHPLHVSPDVYVEDIDMTMSLEKVAYFARKL